MSTEENIFKTRDGTPLYTKTWKPTTPSTIHLIFIHGFSDHINAYYNLFPTLSSPPFNITVHGFDQRGWGRSVQLATHAKSARGLTGDTHLVLSDIHDFILHVSKQLTSSNTSPSPSPSPTTPKLFLMGHSMGGAESLLYLLTTPPQSPPLPIPISGLALESPHIAFPPTSQPSPLLVLSGRLASKVLPNMQMVQKLDSSAMCRDPRVCKDWENDELCHDTGTLRGLAGLLDRAAALDALGSGKKPPAGLGHLGELGVPVFWAHGTEDRVCDFAASRRLYRVLEREKGDNGSVFKAYEGGYHKIHGEPEGMGEEFARDVGGWILGVAALSAGGGGGGEERGVKGQQRQQQQQTSETVETHEVVESEDSEGVKSRL